MIACNECGGPSSHPADGCTSVFHAQAGPKFGRVLVECSMHTLGSSPRAYVEVDGKVVCELAMSEARLTMRPGSVGLLSFDLYAESIEAESHTPGFQ